MELYEIRLADGSTLKAGADQRCAIADVQLTRSVNPETELMPGGVCSDLLEVTVLDPENLLQVSAGTELTLCSSDGTALGLFYGEKPERTQTGQYRITAYDAVSRLDQDLGQWLFSLKGWPYTLQTFARMVCSRCGLEVVNELPINGGYLIGAFSGGGITGRKLMQWICQLGGCFCRANPQGQLAFGWYEERDLCLRPTGDLFYYSGGLSDADYTTWPIEKVQLHLKSEDVGAVYPDEEGQKNTLRITGNYLLGNSGAQEMEEAARQLYERVQGISYTPCTLRCAAGCGVKPGDVIRVEDRSGRERQVYVMSSQEQGGVLTLHATGSARRDSCGAVNIAAYKGLTGKVLNLRADIEGLKIENADAKENMASFSLNLDGIASQVRQNRADADRLQTAYSVLEQTGEGLQLQVQTILEEGTQRVTTKTGYTFDEEGLKITKQGQEMENLLDHTGMYVRRSGQVILQANNQGVAATDVTVRNFLVIGDHARLEDYADGADLNRTACFYLS